MAAAIRSLHPDMKRRIRRGLDELRANPSIGKDLKQELAGWKSLRVGRIRIVYRERGAAIEISAIGPRSSIYIDAAARLRPRS